MSKEYTTCATTHECDGHVYNTTLCRCLALAWCYRVQGTAFGYDWYFMQITDRYLEMTLCVMGLLRPRPFQATLRDMAVRAAPGGGPVRVIDEIRLACEAWRMRFAFFEAADGGSGGVGLAAAYVPWSFDHPLSGEAAAAPESRFTLCVMLRKTAFVLVHNSIWNDLGVDGSAKTERGDARSLAALSRDARILDLAEDYERERTPFRRHGASSPQFLVRWFLLRASRLAEAAAGIR